MESLTIRDEAGRLVPCTFTDSQEIMWADVAPALDTTSKLWFIVLKARQVYATTFFENLVFVRSLAKPNTNSLIIAHDLASAGAIFEMARRFHDHLPLPRLKAPKVKEIEFPFLGGPSRLRVVSAGTMAKGRGTTQSCIHASEVAFWPHAEVLTGLFQAIPDLPDTVWVLESTANGMTGNGQPFFDQWNAAVGGRSELTPIFIPWYVMPKYRADPAVPPAEWDDEEQILVSEFGEYGLDGHALAWRRYAIETKTQGSVDLFHQEYPSTPIEAFISTGLPAFEYKSILKQERHVRAASRRGVMAEGKLSPLSKGWLHVWREPLDGHQYVIGVDTSEGLKGGDYGCAQVVDMTNLEQVAMIHGLISPWDMAQQLAQLGKWYRGAIVAVEITGPGHAVQDYLIRVFSYPNLHLWRGKPDQIRPHIGKLYGWETNSYSRPLLIEAGRRAINTNLVVIHDRATIGELSRFSRNDIGKYEAEVGHDDRVLALLVALRSREENFHEAKKAIHSDYSLLDSNILGGVKVVTDAPAGQLTRKRVMDGVRRRADHATKHWSSY